MIPNEFFRSTPQQYMDSFYDFSVWTLRNGVQSISTNKYLSTGVDRKGNKKNVFNNMQSFLRGLKSNTFDVSDFPLFPFNEGKIEYSWNKVLGPFNGKGVPETYQRFMAAADYWLAIGCRKKMHRPSAWHGVSSVPSLKTFADDYMGLDCNAYVGGYFGQNYSETGWHTSSGWDKNGFYKGPKRNSVDDIKSLDVLVQYTEGGKHVALIDDVPMNGDGTVRKNDNGSVTVKLFQSANSKKGLWSGNCFLKIDGSGNAITSGGYNLTFNKGAFGVIGANE